MILAAAVIAGSLGILLFGHNATTRGADGAAARALSNEVATRNRAAAWVASQVTQGAIVSCDPLMCEALEAQRIPASDLDELRPGTGDPLSSVVIVATAAVRSQFGGRLSSVYAPAVIASFGSGSGQIAIRVIASHGAAAYESALSADLAARKASRTLLTSPRIEVSATARRQLSAGQVDSRLLITIADMASQHPVYIAAFSDSGPGAGADGPLRSVDLTGIEDASPGNFAYVHSIIAFLNAARAPYRVARAAMARLAGGQPAFRIEFDAPSPLGLLSPPSS